MCQILVSRYFSILYYQLLAHSKANCWTFVVMSSFELALRKGNCRSLQILYFSTDFHNRKMDLIASLTVSHAEFYQICLNRGVALLNFLKRSLQERNLFFDFFEALEILRFCQKRVSSWVFGGRLSQQGPWEISILDGLLEFLDFQVNIVLFGRLVKVLPEFENGSSELFDHFSVLFGVFYLVVFALLNQAHDVRKLLECGSSWVGNWYASWVPSSLLSFRSFYLT